MSRGGKNFIDRTGQRIGHWTVLERGEDYVSPKGYKHVRWVCQCDCGAIKLVDACHLVEGKTQACSDCLKRYEDLTGMRFGRLVAIEMSDIRNPSGIPKWKCQCDCGNTCYVTASSLHSGITKSCGCLAKETVARVAHEVHKRFNRFEAHEDYYIGYTQKDEPFIIDADDFDKVKDICWYKRPDGYFAGEYEGKPYLLHRFIMNPPDGLVVDHINRRKEDNRKINLRVISQANNVVNSDRSKNNISGCVGVIWLKREKCWIAFISRDNHQVVLGYYKDMEDAIAARKKGERDYYGEFSFESSQKLAEQNGYIDLTNATDSGLPSDDKSANSVTSIPA